jgi:membrane protein YqaA with SNARE-associated domain
MFWHAIAHRALRTLRRRTETPTFPPLIATSSFLATITFALPVEVLVTLTALMAPRRWISIGVFAALGSTLASVGLYLAFHHLGWNLLIEWYPDIARSKARTDATRWLSRYGSSALFVLMAFPLPVPKVPALAFAGICRMPVFEVLLAIGLGKLLKYNVYALIVSRFPERFRALYGALAQAGEQDRTEVTAARSLRATMIETVRVRRWFVWPGRR